MNWNDVVMVLNKPLKQTIVMDTKTKIILGVIGGVAAAALITMIVAPGKLSALKKELQDKASGFAEDIDCLLGDVKEQLTGVVKSAAEKQVKQVSKM
jgi:hypothetical protein